MLFLQRFSAVIMRIREPKTTALIFSSGKLVSLILLFISTILMFRIYTLFVYSLQALLELDSLVRLKCIIFFFFRDIKSDERLFKHLILLSLLVAIKRKIPIKMLTNRVLLQHNEESKTLSDLLSCFEIFHTR